jgi:hypothetical protein
MEIKQMGSVRTYGGKAHLAYTFIGADGKEHFTVACSCKGTSNGQMQRGVFEIGLMPTCKPSLKRIAANASPIAHAWNAK